MPAKKPLPLRDRLLLALICRLLRWMSPGAVIDARLELDRFLDWELHRETEGAKKVAPSRG
ncbi:MAG: hypothetical protein ACP5JV_08945 [Thermus sp.]|uniref:hypothetical protein n=1 Tax=Thermus sp. TaxID=275 RepID=UPI003D145E12